MHNVIARSRRLVITTLVAAAFAVALVASAGAAQSGSYKGKTVSGKLPVSFNLSGGKVRNFKATISLYCAGDYASGTFGTYKFDAVIPPRAIAVRSGRFNYVGKDRYRSDIEIHGRFVSGRKAKGWVQMGGGGCSGKTDFWATLRN